MSSKKCVVFLCPGNLNFGDNAILHTWLKLFEGIFSWRDEIVILGAETGYIMQFVDNYTYQITATDALHRYIWRNTDQYVNAQSTIDRLLNSDGFTGDSFEPAILSLNRLFARADYVHLLGGGILNEKWKDIHVIFSAAVQLAEKYHKKILLTGQTVGPLTQEDKDWLRPWFSKAGLLDLRDQSSFSYLKTCCDHTAVTVDDTMIRNLLSAGTVPAAYRANNHDTHQPHLNVCIQGWNIEQECYDHVFRTLAVFLQKYCEKHPQTKLYLCELSPLDGDVEYARRLQELLCGKARVNSAIISLPNYPVEFAIELIQTAEINIGTRFHMALFSLLAGKTAISLVLDDYYQLKMEGLYKLFDAVSFCPIREITLELLERWTTGEAVRVNQQALVKKARDKLVSYYEATEDNWPFLYQMRWKRLL